MLPTDTLNKAVSVLTDGGLLIYPTDTIWGLGCDPWNETAFRKIFEVKERKGAKPLILLVSSIVMLKKYVVNIHPRIETLLAYHDRPLTIVYREPRNLPEYLLAEDGSIAMRIVKEGVCHQLIEGFGRPVTSTSPNKQGEPPPANFNEISSAILSAADMTLLHWRHREELLTNEPSVIATYNEKGELEFIRE